MDGYGLFEHLLTKAELVANTTYPSPNHNRQRRILFIAEALAKRREMAAQSSWFSNVAPRQLPAG